MSYTISQLASFSGVSIRTLHWYDEIGLLKPAYCGESGSRFYEEEQLLRLQQILFFRELGFKLGDIQKVLASSDFNKIKALRTHKQLLEQGLDRTERLIRTIEDTVLRLEGESRMSDQDLYKGFEMAKDQANEKCLAKYGGTIAEEIILKRSQKNEEIDLKERQRLEREGHEIYKAVSDCVDQELDERSDQVQALVRLHYALMASVHDLDKDVYLSYAQLYVEHPTFRGQLDAYHPGLADFLAEAMRVYAYREPNEFSQ